MPRPILRPPCCLLGSVLLLLAACRDDDVTAYRVPKAKDPVPPALAAARLPPSHPSTAPAPAAAGAGLSGPAVATAAGAALSWTAPAHWQAKAAGAMRKGSYTIAGDAGATADLGITAFPGDVGGEAANVNRWRSQVGLAALPDAQTAGALQRLEAHGLKVAVLDVAGQGSGSATRLLGAIVPVGGATWFFKLVGPDALVARERAAFLAFLATVQPASATP
jgi:hypothetical protein